MLIKKIKNRVFAEAFMYKINETKEVFNKSQSRVAWNSRLLIRLPHFLVGVVTIQSTFSIFCWTLEGVCNTHLQVAAL